MIGRFIGASIGILYKYNIKVLFGGAAYASYKINEAR